VEVKIFAFLNYNIICRVNSRVIMIKKEINSFRRKDKQLIRIYLKILINYILWKFICSEEKFTVPRLMVNYIYVK
jgi:hypothetical protein